MRAWLPALALVMAVPPLSLPAADQSRGQLLYENQCVHCHDSRVHVRENRSARSIEDVREWVGRWNRTLALKWDAQTQDDVSAYVYRRFYRAAP